MPSLRLSPRQQQHLSIAITLFCLLFGFYLLTFRSEPISGDELALFSTTESLTKYGELRIYSLFYQYPGNSESPWSSSVHEPAQIVAATPLYWIALQLEPLGLLHTVWLFNLFVTAAIGVAFYWNAINLGYRALPSSITAIIVGLATMLYPYSQTFFRESLATLWVMIAFGFAFRLNRRWHWGDAVGITAMILLALLTKEVMLLILPVLLFVILPRRFISRNLYMWAGGMVGILLLAIASAILSQALVGGERFNVAGYAGRLTSFSLEYMITVAGAYLLSPGRSLWATSPILLLSLYGTWLAFRGGNKRLALAPWLLLLVVTLGYGLIGRDWHGGRGWGTRYLLHVVPVMGLLLLPVMRGVIEQTFKRLWQLPMAFLLGFSVLVQLGGLLVPIGTFYQTLSAQFPDDPISAFYETGTWQLSSTQWYIHLKTLRLDAFEVAWRYANPFWVAPFVSMLLIVGSGWLLWRLHNRPTPRLAHTSL